MARRMFLRVIETINNKKMSKFKTNIFVNNARLNILVGIIEYLSAVICLHIQITTYEQ